MLLKNLQFRDVPTAKNEPTQNVNSIEIEKPGPEDPGELELNSFCLGI